MLHSQQCGYENLQNFTSDENEKLVDFRDNAKVRRRYSPQEGRAMRRALRNNRQAPAAFSSEPLKPPGELLARPLTSTRNESSMSTT
jgi:hypothetical protein